MQRNRREMTESRFRGTRKYPLASLALKAPAKGREPLNLEREHPGIEEQRVFQSIVREIAANTVNATIDLQSS